MQGVGVYTGTFDPIHKGHVAFAGATATQLRLAKVYFIPETSPRLKQNVTALPLRVQQIQKAITPRPELDVITLSSSQFSIAETLPELQALIPNNHITILVGSDVALQMANWPNMEALVATCSLAIGLRSTQSSDEVEQAMQHLEKIAKHPVIYNIIKTRHADKASSQYRH